MINSPCPLCGDKTYSVVYEQLPACKEASLVKCGRCGLIYTLLREVVNTDNLYNDEVYQVVENRGSVFDRIIVREYSNVLRQVTRLTGRTGSLMDFGAGKGQFGNLAQHSGWEVKCVETAPERAAYAKKVYGLEVSTAFFNGGAIFNRLFNVITLFHVLEHLPHPRPLLEELIKGNLEKDGIMVIEVPNIGSWQSSIAGSKWLHLDVPRHINHFTPQRLVAFTEELGLVCRRKSFFSVHLGVLGMLDSLLKLFGYRKNIIYELKNNKNALLLLRIAVLLPFAYVMEGLAALAGKGGVIRLYLQRKS